MRNENKPEAPTTTAVEEALSLELASVTCRSDKLPMLSAEKQKTMDVTSVKRVDVPRIIAPPNVDEQLGTEIKQQPTEVFDLKSLKPVKTILHDCTFVNPVVTYGNVDWKMFVRKEVNTTTALSTGCK